MSTPESFTCPCCGMVSHHPDDIRFRYCGRCAWWTGDPELGHPHHGAPCPPQAARQLQEAVAKAGPPGPPPVVTFSVPSLEPLDPGGVAAVRWDALRAVLYPEAVYTISDGHFIGALRDADNVMRAASLDLPIDRLMARERYGPDRPGV